MRAIANTRISILRGTEEDEFGNEVDSETPFLTGIPAALTEQTRQEATGESATPRVVRFTVCRVSSDTPVLESDRVKDEGTGVIYPIMGVSQTGGFGMKNDLRIDLKRTT